MEFALRSPPTHAAHAPAQDIKLAQGMAQKLTREYPDLIKAIVLARPARPHAHSPQTAYTELLPLYVIVDDLSHRMTKENIDEYVAFVKDHLKKYRARFTVRNIKLSAYWDSTRKMTAEQLDLLRNGISVYDTGFFRPLQALLYRGRIMPSYESMGVYYGRGRKTLKFATQHLLQAALDLYWATIDAAHAVLMHHGVMPPAPKEVEAELRKLAKHGVLESSCAETMKKFYALSKQITHKELVELSGKEYDSLLKEAKQFVLRMKKALG